MSLLPLVDLDPKRLGLPTVPMAFGEGGDHNRMDVDLPDEYWQPDDKDQDAELRARLAAAQRDRHSSPASWDDLSPDEQAEISKACANFAEAFEDAPTPNPDRVGVPHPTMICKDNWRPDENALAFCGITRVSREWCTKFLVRQVCVHERQYWAALGVDFELVKDAITRRDGVLIDEKNSTVTSISLNAQGEPPNQAPWNTAVAHIMRARYWFPIYKENADPFFPRPADGDDGDAKAESGPRHAQHRNPTKFGKDGLLSLTSAVQFVAIAQTFVRMEDGWTERSEPDQLEESQLVKAAMLQTFVRTEDGSTERSEPDRPRDEWSKSVYFERPAVLYAARSEFMNPVFDDVYFLAGRIGIDQTGMQWDAYTPYLRPIDRWLNIAKQIIAVFGPPDVWNTSGIQFMGGRFQSLPLTFSSSKVKVSTPGSTRLVSISDYIATINAPFTTTDGGKDVPVGGKLYHPDWPMGLYDVSKVVRLADAFRNNARFNHYIGGWDVRNCLDFEFMFAGSAFNKSISGWRPEKAQRLRMAFHTAWFFNQPLDDWTAHLPWEGTAELRLVAMFEKAKKFRQPIPALASRLAHAESVRPRRILAHDMFKNCAPFHEAIASEIGRERMLGEGIHYTAAVVNDASDTQNGARDERFRRI